MVLHHTTKSLRGLLLFQGDVARGPRPHGVNGLHLIHHVTRAEIEQIVLGIWRGNRDAAHAAQLPQQPAFQVVRAVPLGAGNDQLGALAVFPNIGRGPVALFVALDAKQLFAVAGVECQQVRLLVVVVDDVHAVLIHHRRGGGPPAETHLVADRVFSTTAACPPDRSKTRPRCRNRRISAAHR